MDLGDCHLESRMTQGVSAFYFLCDKLRSLSQNFEEFLGC